MKPTIPPLRKKLLLTLLTVTVFAILGIAVVRIGPPGTEIRDCSAEIVCEPWQWCIEFGYMLCTMMNALTDPVRYSIYVLVSTITGFFFLLLFWEYLDQLK